MVDDMTEVLQQMFTQHRVSRTGTGWCLLVTCCCALIVINTDCSLESIVG
jgi:hypothetical protein